jgi:hypothetical protein
MDDLVSRITDPRHRAERYRQLALEYSQLAARAWPPYLRPYYDRLAEEYRLRAAWEFHVADEAAAATLLTLERSSLTLSLRLPANSISRGGWPLGRRSRI